MKLIKRETEEIEALHAEIVAAARMSLQKAIKIGALLTSVKDRLEHGAWGSWLESNVSFSQRTAGNYMRLHEKRGQLKLAAAANLTIKDTVKSLREKKRTATRSSSAAAAVTIAEASIVETVTTAHKACAHSFSALQRLIVQRHSDFIDSSHSRDVMLTIKEFLT